MGDPTKGLIHKFDVTRTDGTSAPGQKHDGCDYFVLDLTHDPHALPALMSYAESCRETFPLLARDLDAKVKAMAYRIAATPEPPADAPTAPEPDAVSGSGNFGVRSCGCYVLNGTVTLPCRRHRPDPDATPDEGTALDYGTQLAEKVLALRRGFHTVNTLDRGTRDELLDTLLFGHAALDTFCRRLLSVRLAEREARAALRPSPPEGKKE